VRGNDPEGLQGWPPVLRQVKQLGGIEFKVRRNRRRQLEPHLRKPTAKPRGGPAAVGVRGRRPCGPAFDLVVGTVRAEFQAEGLRLDRTDPVEAQCANLRWRAQVDPACLGSPRAVGLEVEDREPGGIVLHDEKLVRTEWSECGELCRGAATESEGTAT